MPDDDEAAVGKFCDRWLGGGAGSAAKQKGIHDVSFPGTHMPADQPKALRLSPLQLLRSLALLRNQTIAKTNYPGSKSGFLEGSTEAVENGVKQVAQGRAFARNDIDLSQHSRRKHAAIDLL